MDSIPIITTGVRTGHNPGDTFIGAGLQYLFDRTLGPCAWVPVDRFNSTSFRTVEPIARMAPYVVYGGMPQYRNYEDKLAWYDRDMWTKCLRPWGAPVFAMAGGLAGHASRVSADEYVRECAASELTRRVIRDRVSIAACFTVRDPYAHALLNKLGVENHYLPCSALWATRAWGVGPASNRPFTFLIPPTIHVRRNLTWRRLAHVAATGGIRHPLHRLRLFRTATNPITKVGYWVTLYRLLEEHGHAVRVLCHEQQDYLALRGLIRADHVWYHGDVYALLRQYSLAHTVVSARVHGSLPAYSLDGTKVVNIPVDIRASTVESVPGIETLDPARCAPSDIVAAVDRAAPSGSEMYDRWEADYAQAIMSALT